MSRVADESQGLSVHVGPKNTLASFVLRLIGVNLKKSNVLLFRSKHHKT